MKLAILLIILGVITMSTALCPCPWSKVIIGGLVVITGALVMIRRRRANGPNKTANAK